MKILCMPQAFKGTLSAAAAAEAMAEGVRSALPQADIHALPMADGGDDTLYVLVTTTGGMYFTTEVWDPLGRRIKARWGLLGDGETAVIEMAEASGLRLLKAHERDPLTATSVGTGQLIRQALEAGYRKILVGVGGSATVDGGTGAVKALGGHFQDAGGLELPSGGAALAGLDTIDLRLLDRRLKGCTILAACDMNMPLCGPRGAWTFTAQKGATPAAARDLEKAMERYGWVVQQTLGVDLRGMEMAGSAGGLAGGLHACLGARLRPGAELVLEASGMGERIKEADLVIVGEGRMDANTFLGKGPGAVAARAKQDGVAVLAVVGSLVEDIPDLRSAGIQDVETLQGPAVPEREAMNRSGELLAAATAKVFQRFLQSRSERSAG